MILIPLFAFGCIEFSKRKNSFHSVTIRIYLVSLCGSLSRLSVFCDRFSVDLSRILVFMSTVIVSRENVGY